MDEGPGQLHKGSLSRVPHSKKGRQAKAGARATHKAHHPKPRQNPVPPLEPPHMMAPRGHRSFTQTDHISQRRSEH